MAREQPTLPSPQGAPPDPAAPLAAPVAPPAAPLYTAELSDPRERAAQPRERLRGRAAIGAEPTSDVTRFRGVLAAALAGAGATLAAALLLPPSGGFTAPGPLSRPHAQAKLECSSCHTGAAPASSAAASDAKLRSGALAVPSRACATCHGAHGSRRTGHARELAAGAMTCSTCHPIHKSDQGVAFSPTAPPLRFAPGVEAPLSAIAFQPARPATVSIPTAGSCKGCHAIESPRDPITRCLITGQETLGDARPIVCFDEHQPALPPEESASSGVAKGRAPGRGAAPGDLGAGGVCGGQHTPDRVIAWEAAREAAVALPVLSRASLGGAPWIWPFAGVIAAALAFAAARGRHAITARRRRKEQTPAAEMLKPAARIRLPQIDVNTCLGCYACVDACPYDVLEIDRYVAVVARPEACCGLTLCEQRCPNGSLRITDGDPIGERPRLRDDLSSPDMPGLYLSGDITGLPLIKNAIHQGAHAVEQIARDLPGRSDKSDGALDLLIIGAGPSGISAALKAKELGLTFAVIEQGNVAQSIQSFPRGKLVFDQPLELPVTGKLWLKESSKEELLSHWLRIVRKEELPIHADTRMTQIERRDGGFSVTTEPREGGRNTRWSARRVLLAIGQRGSPRRLPFALDPEVESRVHYHLADARSFEGKLVIVVGLGDVAMEAAIALCRQPNTKVTIVHRGEEFNRGKSRNIAEVRRMIEAGRAQIRYKAEITGMTRERVTLKTPEGSASIAYDAVLVLIGSIPPWDVLRGAGVRTVAEGPQVP
jgi:thioredoxin reductase/NAD-dependent dihydropyrimidine dehydrogenase PreA subunit